MNPDRILKMAAHLPRRVVREAIMVLDLVALALTNRFGKKLVTQMGGPVVSLTTFGKRAEKVHFAIESIARGIVRPSRLILWIDDEALLANLPAPIRRLEKRGLEVIACRNYGPHKKYFPYVQSLDVSSTAFVTADDDILYPHYWLKALIEANQQFPETVNCFWAHIMKIDESGIGKYATFQTCNSTLPSARHIAIGAMGVIYPARFLLVLKRAGDGFIECCPRADDLWLHVQALRAGFQVRQVLPRLPYYSFQSIPGSQQTALSYENVTYDDGNDRQLRATYTEEDFRVLRA